MKMTWTSITSTWTRKLSCKSIYQYDLIGYGRASVDHVIITIAMFMSVCHFISFLPPILV